MPFAACLTSGSIWPGGSEFRGGMRTIYPSVTYPIHVSILTGCYAGKHQITSNFKFTTTNRDDNWIWFSDRIAVEDIFTAAKACGPEDGLRVVARHGAATRTSTT